MRGDAWKSYEGWRGLWLSGGDSNDIAALRFHGLRGAVAGAACDRARERPAPSAAHVEGLIADAAMAEAASQVRRLLCMASAAAAVTTACNYEENRHA